MFGSTEFSNAASAFPVRQRHDESMSKGKDWLQGHTHIRNTPIDQGLPSLSILLQGRTLRDSMPE